MTPRFLLKILLLGAIAGGALPCRAKTGSPDVLNRQLNIAAGPAARLVWLRDYSKDGRDIFAEGDQLGLMALDSAEKKGSRVLLPERGRFCRPLLTPDGSNVVFTVKHPGAAPLTFRPEIRIIPWGGGAARKVADGYAVEVWRDPAGRTWVYALEKLADGSGANVNGTGLIRIPLDTPETVERVMDGRLITSDNFQMDRTGSTAFSVMPWPHAGTLTLSDGSFHPLIRGCWPAQAPDESGLMWVLDGPHRHLRMLLPSRGRMWDISFSDAADMKRQSGYHPRWSNHPALVTWSGPYSSHVSRKRGRGARIFVGQLNPAATTFETSVKLTDHEPYPDIYPDLWVRGGDEVSLDTAKLGPKKGGKPLAVHGTTGRWPGNEKGLLYAWKSAAEADTVTIAGKSDPAPVPHGYAWLARNGQLCGQGGHFAATADYAAAISEAADAGQGWSLAFAAEPLRSGGTLISCGGLRVAQQADGFLLVEAGGKSWTADAGLPAGQVSVIQVSMGSGGAGPEVQTGVRRCRVTPGKAVPAALPGGAPVLRFGADAAGGDAWHGMLEGIAIAAGPDAPRRVQAAAEMLMAELAGRTPVTAVRVTARVLSVSTPLEPSEIGSYSRAWTGGVCEVLKVNGGGARLSGRIGVAWWTVMDRQKVPGALPAPGAEIELLLEPAAGHPMFESERGSDESDDDTLPLFLSMERLPGGK